MALPQGHGDVDREGVPPTITELVQTYKDATGVGVRALELRSSRGGHRPVGFSYFQKILRGDVRAFPAHPEETISGIARALDTTELAVVLGYCRQLGVDVRMPVFASQVPPDIDSAVPLAERRQLLQYLRVRTTGEETPAPRLVDTEITDDEIAEHGLIPGRPAARSTDEPGRHGCVAH